MGKQTSWNLVYSTIFTFYRVVNSTHSGGAISRRHVWFAPRPRQNHPLSPPGILLGVVKSTHSGESEMLAVSISLAPRKSVGLESRDFQEFIMEIKSFALRKDFSTWF